MAPSFRLSLLLLFIALPLIEIAVFIKVGQEIGMAWTIFIVIATAVVGTWLLQAQGFGVLAKARSSVLNGEMPIEPVIESVLLLIAGAFLLTPGLITDGIGFLLLVPPIRVLIARHVLKHVLERFLFFPTADDFNQSSQGHDPTDKRHDPSHKSKRGKGVVIEGEFERLDENTIEPDRRH